MQWQNVKKKKKKSSTLDGFFCSVNLSVTPLLHFFAELLKKKKLHKQHNMFANYIRY